MMAAARRIYPLLDVAEHREAGIYYPIIHEYKMILANTTCNVQPPTATETGTGYFPTCTAYR
ncbi:hypothetical protein ACSZM0_15290 [Aeromonas hydrophila]